jgi:hypothetical protein
MIAVRPACSDGMTATICCGAARHFADVSGLAAGAAGVGLVAVFSLLLGAFGSDFVFDFLSDLASDADSPADELLFEA